MNPVELKGEAFGLWVEATYPGVSYDSATFWDMQRVLTDDASCPDELRDILRQRHALRPPADTSPLFVSHTTDFESEWVERGSRDGE